MGLIFRALGAIELLIVGLIGAGKVLSTLMESGFLDAIVMLFFVTIAFVLSMPLYILGGLMDDVESLHKQISELKEANKGTDKDAKRNNLLYAGSWKCKCGHTNGNHVSTCTCGRSRYVVDKSYGQPVSGPDAATVQAAQEAAEAQKKQEEAILNAGGWKCACGRTNYGYISTCACGKGKLEVEL
jgi:hypothetical protein